MRALGRVTGGHFTNTNAASGHVTFVVIVIIQYCSPTPLMGIMMFVVICVVVPKSWYSWIGSRGGASMNAAPN